MATLPSINGALTLIDLAKRMAPDGKVDTIVELLGQQNEILTDMRWVEANDKTSHRTTVRTGLPTAIWRKLYQGVPASKSTVAQVTDTIGMLETRAEVDKDLADLSADVKAFRLTEAQAFIESLNQTMATSLFYGDVSVNPERFTGLAPRFSSLSATNAQNIISAGGSGSDNTSIWLVVWGNNTCHGIVPKGSTAGLNHQDLGEYDAFDGSSNRYRAYGDRWQWKAGLTVRDWRYVVRICNVDVSDLVGLTGTQAITASTSILKLMVKAMARIPMMGMGTAVFYCNRTVKEMLSLAALDKTQSVLAFQPGLDQFGKVSPGSVGTGTLTFQGVPVRTCDALLNTETAVS